MIKKINVVLCTLFFSICLGQNVSGVVTDSLGNGVSLAMLSLFKDDVFISNSTSTKVGAFKLDAAPYDYPLQLVVSKLGYGTQTIKLDSANYITVVLNDNFKVLDELIIESAKPDVSARKDVVSFNLEKLLNGSEIKLKNIIDKLPGLSIDANGKIKYNGALLDHLLIDGDKFFGKNHQLATENLTADMIADIELLKNFKDLSDFNSVDLNKTALNIKIKDKFKLLLKGNLEAEVGVINRYKAHNHLYKFGTSNKFSLILNSNNVNYSVISVQDFIDQKNSTGDNVLKDFNSTKIVKGTEENNLPPFLFASDLIKSRTISNGTLNFTKKINSNQRFEFVSIANSVRQNDFSQHFMQFYDNSAATSLNQDQALGKSKFWTNFLEFENRLSPNAYQKVRGYLLFNTDSENQNLFNSIPDLNSNTTFNTNNHITSTQIGANVLYKKEVFNNLLLDATFFTDYKTASTNKNLNSTNGFSWFNYLDNEIDQKATINRFNWGGKVQGNLNLINWKFNFKLQSTLFNEQLVHDNTLAGNFTFESNFLKAKNLISSIVTRDFLNAKLQLQLLFDFQNDSYQVRNKFNKSIFSFLPAFAFKYRLTNNLLLSAQHGLESENYNPNQFLTGNVLKDYRTVLLQNTLQPIFIPKHKSTVNLSYADLYKNVLMTLSYSHSNQNKTFSESSTNFNYYSNLSFDYLGSRTTDFVFVNFSKKWNHVPLGINSYANYSKTKSNFLINNTYVPNITNDFYSTIEFLSYFKKSIFNFKGAVQYGNTVTENLNPDSFKSSLQRFTPLVSFFGSTTNKKINWDISGKYQFYKSSQVSDKPVLDLGFMLAYNLNPQLNFYVNGANILNISNGVFKNQIQTTSYYTQQIQTRILPGYINVGIKYAY